MTEAARLIGNTASVFLTEVLLQAGQAQFLSICICICFILYSSSTGRRRTTVSPSLPSRNVVPVSSFVTRCFTSLTVAS
jgi:hypothetical protein